MSILILESLHYAQTPTYYLLIKICVNELFNQHVPPKSNNLYKPFLESSYIDVKEKIKFPTLEDGIFLTQKKLV